MCPAKKTLQIAADDPALLITNYKGEHNHDPPKLHNRGIDLRKHFRKCLE